MEKFTPKTHYRRLAALLGAFFVVFVIVKTLFVPADWVSGGGDWYRGGAIEDNIAWPMAFGGNESCIACHQEAAQETAKLNHKTLSCESCHGPLADHVKDNQKIAAARVNMENDWDCLNCHDERITKPEGFPQFSKTRIKTPSGMMGRDMPMVEKSMMEKYMRSVEAHKELDKEMLCTSCHNAHDPKL